MRRDFWETTEGRGSQSSLKRDEDRSAEVRLRRRHSQEMMKKGEGDPNVKTRDTYRLLLLIL